MFTRSTRRQALLTFLFFLAKGLAWLIVGGLVVAGAWPPGADSSRSAMAVETRR